MQKPAWQVSDGVHALASLHWVPSLTVGFVQEPESQTPARWHWSCAWQLSSTVTCEVQVAVWPYPSVAVYVNVVVPLGKLLDSGPPVTRTERVVMETFLTSWRSVPPPVAAARPA